MSIGPLIQQAFVRSPEFNDQVSSIVVRQALYKHDVTADISVQSQQDIARVVRSPNSYGFVQSMVASSTWDATYDVWASNPAGQDGLIQAQVDNLWDLLVGPITITPPETPP